MELTPETVRRAEFGRSWGGYDMREVDTFLEEIGNGVDGLHARIREITLRAERAESRGGGGLDDTIKRTLTLAQRAADLVVSEAKGVAERTTAEAKAQAARIVEEASDEAERTAARAHHEGARVVADHLERAQQEHRVLSDQLAAERSVVEAQLRETRRQVAALQEHAHGTRDRLRATLTDHLTRLDLLEFEAPPVGVELVSAAPVSVDLVSVAPVLADPVPDDVPGSAADAPGPVEAVDVPYPAETRSEERAGPSSHAFTVIEPAAVQPANR